MATDPRKRQKKLERRTAKRKDRKHQLVREQSAGLAERLTAAAKYPVLHSWVSEDLWTQGMGWVLLSRQLPDGSVAASVFLVDRYCLGVKDAMVNINSRSLYESKIVRLMRAQFTSRAVSPATARKFVESAVAYAQGLGFPPHPDYHKAKLLFGDIDAAEAKEELEFGQDGKPYFIAGPNDTPQRCRQILNTLLHGRSPDEFHYLMPAIDLGEALPDALKHGKARLVGEDREGRIHDHTVDFDAPR
jgi:hypothetical protein